MRLGARPKDPDCYDDGKVSYARIAASPAFQEAIHALIDESHAKRIALMCAEKEPLECHRTILVGRALAQRDTELGSYPRGRPHRTACRRWKSACCISRRKRSTC